MTKYKMNQEAIDELSTINKLFRMCAYWPIETIIEKLPEVSPNTYWQLEEVHGFNFKEMSREENHRLIDVLRFIAQDRFDHFRCDVDAECCNRIEHEPLDVEVVA